MCTMYVARDTTPLSYVDQDGKKHIVSLLWGDRVEILAGDDSATPQVCARGFTGTVDRSALGDTSLLELYFIDVGNGDGILIRTPDDRHIMIDGGYDRAHSPTGKNAADFVDWKFVEDYRRDRIELDAMITSHCDADHYGGLWDLLDVAQSKELDAKGISVDQFYHAGVGWWVNPATNDRWLGPISADKQYLTQLLGDRSKVEDALDPQATPRLQGNWAQFMKCVVQAKTRAGGSTPITRLSQATHDYLPGFTSTANGGVAIRVLGPLETTVNGQPMLLNHGVDSKNTNGNSVLLRLDYGNCRILLTGDLNVQSQKALLKYYTGQCQEFQCDVTKACHHGSDEISYTFMDNVKAGATVISSGDCEDLDHPRPSIVAVSALTGYKELKGDTLVTPLVYATELARSINLGDPTEVIVTDNANNKAQCTPDRIEVKANVMRVADLRPSTATRTLDRTYIVTGLTYGLVNIRTDGKTILCATLSEKGNAWHIKKFNARH